MVYIIFVILFILIIVFAAFDPYLDINDDHVLLWYNWGEDRKYISLYGK